MVKQSNLRPNKSQVSKRKKILFAAITLLFIYFFIEFSSFFALKIMNLQSSSQGYPEDLYIFDEKLDYKYKPNFEGHFSSTTYGSIPIVINSLGFRDHEFRLKKDKNFYRVLLLGDSITFGAGVRMEETYAKITERLVKERCGKNFQLINAGVNSYHFAHYYIFIKEHISKFDPDHLMIGLCINDVRPKEVAGPRYLVQTNSSDFDLHSVKHWIKKLIKKSPTFQLISSLVFSNTYMRQRYSSRWITEVMLSWNNSKLIYEFRKMLSEIKVIADENRIRFTIILFPELQQILDYDKYKLPREKLLGILDDIQVQYVDLYDTFRSKKTISKYYLPGDTVHFTPEGHKLIAQVLSEHIFCKK